MAQTALRRVRGDWQVKAGLEPAQIRNVAVGGAWVAVMAILGWLGVGALMEKQVEVQALADRMGNPALAALLSDAGALPRVGREGVEIQRIEEDLKEKAGVMTKSWSEGTREASGEGEEWAKDPGKWKDRLIEIQSDLLRQSISNNVKLSPEFYLGLENYRQKSPTAEEVPDLALHLSLAKRLVEKLFQARRAKEQYPTPCELRVLTGPGSSAAASVGQVARTPASSPRPPAGKPERKTFRLEIRCSPEVLYAYVQRLTVDPWLFIVTDLNVLNEKQAFPLRSEVAKKFSEGTPGTEKTEARLLEMLAGNEAIDVRMVVDFVIWKDPEEAMKKPAARPAP